MEPVKVLTKENKRLEIFVDENPINPRDGRQFGIMYCFHRNYSLGDPHELEKEDVHKIKKDSKNIVLPLYLYDHSGLRISTVPFSCPWDSGQVGIISVSKKDVLKEYNCKRVSKALTEKVKVRLNAEVEIYDLFLCGEVYYFKLSIDGKDVDSCGGFYGSDHDKSGLLDCADWEE